MNYQKNFKAKVYRRIEVPSKLTHSCVFSHNNCQCCCNTGEHISNDSVHQSNNYVSKNKKDKPIELIAPKLNTLQIKLDEINLLQQPTKYRKVTLDYASPAVASMITQKMNFNANKTLFKNLVPLNVNDSFRNLNTKKGTETGSKTPTPDLCNFLDPIPSMCYTITEPEIPLQFLRRPFDYYQSYLSYRYD